MATLKHQMRFETPTPRFGMRVILVSLVLLFLAFQYLIWLGDFGYLRLASLDKTVSAQEAANAVLEKRNQRLRAEVIDLKRGTDALEERARVQLGMIKEGEVFLQVIEPSRDGTVIQPISR